MIRSIILATLTAIIFSVSSAKAQDYYVGLSGRLGGQFGTGAGIGLSGHAGAAFDDIRVEGEITHNAVGGIFADDMYATAFMANGYYDFDTGSHWKPYVGAGIGISRAHIREFSFFGESEGDDTVFAFQAMAGVGYEIFSSTTIFAGYKYFGTSEISVTDANGTAQGNINFHSIEIGFRYGF